MAVRVTCSSGHSLRVAERHIGERVRCPLCRETLTVEPSAARQRTFACPDGHRFRAPVDGAGRCVACPTCRQRVRLPGSRTRTAAAGETLHTVARPVSVPAATERLLPTAMLIGTAVVTLVGIAWYVRSAGIE